MFNTENIIETFTELAPRYEEVVDAELNRFWGWSYTGFVNQLLQRITLPKQGRILDIATGTGVIPMKIANGSLNECTPGDYQREGPGTTIRIHGLDITRSMLARAQKKFAAAELEQHVDLVCASAMGIPYASQSFDQVTCALATHHMDVRLLLAEAGRVLCEGGRLSIADVGGSNLWKSPFVKLLLRLAAFTYFLFQENINRAWAESEAVANVRSMEEWSELLVKAGYQEIKITKLKSKHRWVPEPLVIQAIKPCSGGSE